MSQYKRIFIVGQPGAGKALLAKALAEKLGWQFIDADFGLESRIGRDIQNILGKEGTSSFLDCQYEILNSFLNKENFVVTTDANVTYSDKIQQLLSTEFVVYLKVSTPVQLDRSARNQKPFLLTTDFESFLNKLHERDNSYEEISNLLVDSDDSALEKHVKIIIDILSRDNELPDQLIFKENDTNFFHKETHVPVRLTNQQTRCLKLLAQGKSSKEIAKELHLSHRTGEGSIAKIMELLGCHSSKELIVLYHSQP